MVDTSLILRAARFADLAHSGQTRKYTHRPYIEHPGRVAARISRLDESTEAMVAAAWLHDVVEDCAVPAASLYDVFGTDVAGLVSALTNPSKQMMGLCRADRKMVDRVHIASAPRQVKIIKMADRADNLLELDPSDVDFLMTYVEESTALLEVIRDAGTALVTELEDILLHHRHVLEPHTWSRA